jgi:serine/threonine protein kinase
MLTNLLRKMTFKAIPDYEVLEKIDEGGMSAVYKGRSSVNGALVAIKVFKPKMVKDATMFKRFEQEFRATSQLLHPNIVQSLAFGSDDSTTYLVLEFVEGESLGQRLERDGRLPEKGAIEIITQVAQALQYAHEHGMIHRDVKPDNILLDESGKAKLTDFGLVKDEVNDLRLTGPLSVLGTPHFMAPEQYTDAAHVDARCDIYSLGATLYMAVTGTAPFQASTTFEVLRKQATNQLVPPRELVPDLSAAVDQAICAAMNSNPAERPSSCLALIKSLRPRGKRSSTEVAVRDIAAAAAPGNTDKPAGPERRASLRFPCIHGTSCAMSASLHPDDAEPVEHWPATVQDVSQGGLGLVVGRRFEKGTVLSVELHSAEGTASRSVLASVVRVLPQEFGHWLLGCIFTKPLSKEELQILV